MLVLFAILAVSACNGAGERAGGSERPATTRECPPGSSREPADGAVVTIFHETHTHGDLAGHPDYPGNATFAQYVGLRNALRARLPDPANSLFLGNGDDISPTLRGVRTDGQHTIDAFNAAELDANTFGFNEILFGKEYASPEKGTAQLRELVGDSRFSWVSANVREEADPSRVFAAEQGARRFTVEEVGGVRLAVTGLMSAPPRAEAAAAARVFARFGVRVLDPVEAAREVVPEMRAAADVVVLLSHLTEEETVRVVRSVDGIDAALGTHAGDATERPRVVNGAIVAVAGPMDLSALGELSLVVRDGEVCDFEFRRHLPAGDAYVDREVEAVLARYLRGG